MRPCDSGRLRVGSSLLDVSIGRDKAANLPVDKSTKQNTAIAPINILICQLLFKIVTNERTYTRINPNAARTFPAAEMMTPLRKVPIAEEFLSVTA